eukprot:g4319.t1
MKSRRLLTSIVGRRRQARNRGGLGKFRCSGDDLSDVRRRHQSTASERGDANVEGKRSVRAVQTGGSEGDHVCIEGWVRSTRSQKRITFVNICDGTTVNPLQIVSGCEDTKQDMAAFTTGSCVRVTGRLVRQRNKKKRGSQETSSGDAESKIAPFEIVAHECGVVGPCNSSDYPLQKKYHSLDFLREQLHLRPRSRTIGAVTRVRSEAAYALQHYLREQEFTQVHTPVLTSNDCEGAGELFAVSPASSSVAQPSADERASEHGFFGESDAYLTVSGQLQAEMFACALGRVYSFGPTFRAENSQTRRHLAEFWMLEPEMAFATLDDILNVSEGLVRSCVSHLLDRCIDDLAFFDERLATSDADDNKSVETGLIATLDNVAANPFLRMSYTEAIRVLENKQGSDPSFFEFPVAWGHDLQTEHERWLTEVHCGGCPVFVTDYPAECKPFYMRRNDDDGAGDRPTVGAVDLLVPRIGELVGGSEREERPSLLEHRMREDGMLPHLEWYLDLRRYGTVRHGGFGLGFERLLMFATGMENIRDVIAVPRYPGFVKY